MFTLSTTTSSLAVARGGGRLRVRAVVVDPNVARGLLRPFRDLRCRLLLRLMHRLWLASSAGSRRTAVFFVAWDAGTRCVLRVGWSLEGSGFGGVMLPG